LSSIEKSSLFELCSIERKKNNAGFTLIELLVVISIISLLASVVLASLNSARAKARDARRLADMKEIEKALQFYFDANNAYPGVTYGSGENLAGWEVSFYGSFMEYLAPYLSKTPVDPINSGPPSQTSPPLGAMFNPRPDGTFFYTYYGNYPGNAYGCPFSSSQTIAVIGFRAAETINLATLPRAACGLQPCIGDSPTTRPGTSGTCRNWQTEFDYTIMLSP
jgi:prepilin-type N-terminal cleavage/methylation domain-containing protein